MAYVFSKRAAPARALLLIPFAKKRELNLEEAFLSIAAVVHEKAVNLVARYKINSFLLVFQ